MNIDINKLKELISLVNVSNLSALEIQDGSLKIRLEKSPGTTDNILQNIVQSSNDTGSVNVNSNAELLQKNGDIPSAGETVKAETENQADTLECKVIKAPMVGAFHNLPSSNIGPGTRLKKGDSVCIIEAMKLMNEITMEEDGEIVSIEVSEGEMVEYGQVLVKYK